jgi:hypothetical protein
MGRIIFAPIAAILALGTAMPATAQSGGHGPGPLQTGTWQGSWVSPTTYTYTWQGDGAPQGAPQGTPPAPGSYYQAPQAPYGYTSQADPDYQRMLERCGKLHTSTGATGGVIGGVVGGVIGNRVADGNRTLGTVVGAGVGAVAGVAVDKASNHARQRECDDYFASHAQAQAPAAPGYGYGAYPQGYAQPSYAPQPGYVPYGYAAPTYGYTMVPVAPQPQQACVEKTVVTHRWVSAPVRRRVVYNRPVVIHDKRVRDKRVYTGY